MTSSYITMNYLDFSAINTIYVLIFKVDPKISEVCAWECMHMYRPILMHKHMHTQDPIFLMHCKAVLTISR